MGKRDSLLKVSNLTRGFGSGETRLEVLKGVDFEIKSGELVALMGPSGSGKSTLLNIVGGLLEADGGSISMNDFRYGTDSPSKVVELRRKHIGWIFQDFHLLDHITALGNVAFSLDLSGFSAEESEKRATDSLKRTGIFDRAEHKPDELSGGQSQRVAIARAISGQKNLILADEPTGNLDLSSAEDILELFKELCHDEKNPISILMVTHDPHLASKADRMLLIKEGKVVDSNVDTAWEDK